MPGFRRASSVAAVMGILYLGCFLQGQSTTNTNCTLNGETANCTSNTTDYGAEEQQSYEEGQETGRAIGNGLAIAMQRHAFNKGVKKYCVAHPGREWHYSRGGRVLASGVCPSDADKSTVAYNESMHHHKKVVPSSANYQAIHAYLEKQNLDPRKEKSYERAYKALERDVKVVSYSN